MKKSLFALALTGALAVFTTAQADTVLYGSVRLGVDYSKNHTSTTGTAKRGFDVTDYNSRIGLYGGEELGNGVKVLYQLEWGFDAASGENYGSGFKNRLAYIGVGSETFGTFTIGRQENPFWQTIVKGTILDNYNGVGLPAASVAANFVLNGGIVGGYRNVDGTNVYFTSANKAYNSIKTGEATLASRNGKVIAYTSPTWGGFSFATAAIMSKGVETGYEAVVGSGDSDIRTNKNRGLDAWTLALKYVHESGFYAGASYMQTDYTGYESNFSSGSSSKRPYAYGLRLGFQNEQWGVSGVYSGGQRKQSTNSNVLNSYSSKDKGRGWDIGGQYSFGSDYASTVRASYGQATLDSQFRNVLESAKDTTKLTTWALGFEQKISSRTRAWVEYENTQQKLSTRNYDNVSSAKFKNDKVSIGIRHDF